VKAEGNLHVLVAPYTGDLEQLLILAAAALASSLIQILPPCGDNVLGPRR
jgi:hypothetical protein